MAIKQWFSLKTVQQSVILLTVLIISFGCSGGDEVADNKSYSGTDRKLIEKLNTKNNKGKTIRFKDERIKVYLNTPNWTGKAKEEIRAWTKNTDGLLQFEFVSSSPSVGIEVNPIIHFPFVCGSASPNFNNGEIKKVSILMDPKTWTSICSKTLKHEIGHAIGILAHTDDGGLMDPEGGNGKITDQVARIVKTIYSYPADTPIEELEIIE